MAQKDPAVLVRWHLDIETGPGSHFVNDFSIVIQIRWELVLSITSLYGIISLKIESRLKNRSWNGPLLDIFMLALVPWPTRDHYRQKKIADTLKMRNSVIGFLTSPDVMWPWECRLLYHSCWKFRLNVRRSQRSMRLVRIDVLQEVRNEECDEMNLRQE